MKRNDKVTFLANALMSLQEAAAFYAREPHNPDRTKWLSIRAENYVEAIEIVSRRDRKKGKN